MDLFQAASSDNSGVPAPQDRSPLAVRMRPATLDELVGQEHLLEAGSPLRRLVEPSPEDAGGDAPRRRISPSSVVLWGPPGTGKTTLAYLIARASERRFTELSAVTAGVKDVRAVIEDARRRLVTSGEETILFIDEVHRFSKSQQDALLPAVENRWVTLVAATTENPSFSVISPLLSRSLMLTLRPLEEEHVRRLLSRALTDERGLGGAHGLDDDAADHLLRLAGADARKALTILEAAAGSAEAAQEQDITLQAVERAIDVAAVRYDKAGDQHYDVISAFIKSMRGSDVDAALHYLARMIVAGEDPRFIARRVVIAAAEEVGMADPTALQVAMAAADGVSFIGMPEARILLAQAVVHIATAPKSNASHRALDAAIADVRAGKVGAVPAPLRDGHYAGAKDLGHGVGYRYAHDYPHGIAPQEYAPDGLRGTRYYRPTGHGHEREITSRLEAIHRLLGRDPEGS
ncbi:replication-associated recombination protein A [Bogoriella caseilytica]|uniref:Putative ATPase n=1 Tax=Bogoriella caseilytica TaxID=56055 RepID=A0A3N2B9D9_9MICO|nr:replication-associated recombination protein A [Bogoriella caseilytica]ROR71714.1 putative ATPase [Bogoriella caseilytica]